MSQGKRGRHMKVRRGEANYQAAALNESGEYGRTGRYKPFGQQNTAGVKSDKPFKRVRVRLRNA